MAIDIFINYRSVDEPSAAVLIDQALCQRFGPQRVFRDSRTIAPGTFFPPEIWSAIQECRAVIVVIGQNWLATRPNGERLVDDPGDYVRREIAEALGRGIRVIPVLIGSAALPSAQLLPPDIAELARRQYLRLRTRDAEYDIQRLTDELAKIVGLPGSAGPASDQPPLAQPSVTNHFHEPVNAPRSVFGISYGETG